MYHFLKNIQKLGGNEKVNAILEANVGGHQKPDMKST